MLALLAGLPQKGGEPEMGFRGPEGHKEAGKKEARASFGAVTAVGSWDLVSPGPGVGAREIDLSIATALTGQRYSWGGISLHIPVCCLREEEGPADTRVEAAGPAGEARIMSPRGSSAQTLS